MDEDALRALVSAALERAGDSGKASLAADPLYSMLGEPWGVPGGAQVVLFETVPHASASFYAGIAGDKVFYLTDSPGSFGEMIRAAGLRVTTPQTAIDVACAYVETTRSMRSFSGVIDSPADIDWAPAETPEDQQAISQFKERLSGILRLPAADPAGGGGYDVTLYAVRDETVERRTVTITPEGWIAERSETVEEGLPVPVYI